MMGSQAPTAATIQDALALLVSLSDKKATQELLASLAQQTKELREATVSAAAAVAEVATREPVVAAKEVEIAARETVVRRLEAESHVLRAEAGALLREAKQTSDAVDTAAEAALAQIRVRNDTVAADEAALAELVARAGEDWATARALKAEYENKIKALKTLTG